MPSNKPVGGGADPATSYAERPFLVPPPPPARRRLDWLLAPFRRTIVQQHVHQTFGALATNGSTISVRHGLKNDAWIREQCVPPLGQSMDPAWKPMIAPFHDYLISRADPAAPGTLSYGLSGFGYDVTLAPEYKMFSAESAYRLGVSEIDPKQFNDGVYIACEADSRGRIVMPPKSFLLCRIKEYIRIPDNALAILFNKSTYARCGVHVTTTIMEPGWHGEIVVEITNAAPLPVVLYANEGIGQLVFLEGAKPDCGYGDRNLGLGGKYQGQTGVTTPRMEGPAAEPERAPAPLTPEVGGGAAGGGGGDGWSGTLVNRIEDVRVGMRTFSTTVAPQTKAGVRGKVHTIETDMGHPTGFTVHWDGDAVARARIYTVEQVLVFT